METRVLGDRPLALLCAAGSEFVVCLLQRQRHTESRRRDFSVIGRWRSGAPLAQNQVDGCHGGTETRRRLPQRHGVTETRFLGLCVSVTLWLIFSAPLFCSVSLKRGSHGRA